jgi:hypothetical protein
MNNWNLQTDAKSPVHKRRLSAEACGARRVVKYAPASSPPVVPYNALV